MPALDVTGQRYGRLTALSRAPASGKHTLWVFKCDCGNERTIRLDVVRRGVSSSCGCAHEEALRRTRHGHARHSEKRNATWVSWQAMIHRCTCVGSKEYARYGAVGIAVCDRWRNSYEAFLADMGPRPDGTTLDRFPNKGGDYEPRNCRWATPAQQARNRRANVFVEIDGELKVLLDVARLVNRSPSAAYAQFHKGGAPQVQRWYEALRKGL